MFVLYVQLLDTLQGISLVHYLHIAACPSEIPKRNERQLKTASKAVQWMPRKTVYFSIYTYSTGTCYLLLASEHFVHNGLPKVFNMLLPLGSWASSAGDSARHWRSFYRRRTTTNGTNSLSRKPTWRLRKSSSARA